MNLYQIDNEIEACIASTVDEETGEVVSEEIDFEKLAKLQLERSKKIESLALWYKNLLSDSEQLKKEKEAFAAREKACKNKAESIKRYLDESLHGEKFITDKCIISFKYSSAVEIADDAKLSNEYLRFKTPKPDKTAIRNAIKNGENVPGCRIVDKLNISIK